ncbi:hypothetical protein JAB1_49950 [Janthinobacterium sp. MP5059B]|uniref:HNH endonuclease n=1 Tax=Janthinobacterium sp. MP5059B TaxID=1766683 RepID=UPI000893EFE4|nr:HNH endonuclease [Janthinobacterium sp. MP5059B]OEZ46513.1 hypothetical protein JAB1_49950 [Janthinobacterium sp. MP5059B]
MKNLPIRTIADDLTFFKSAINKATGEKRKFLVSQQIIVEIALNNYIFNINGNSAAPLGLKKGQKAAKAIKAVKDASGAVLVKATPRKLAKKDEHEYYYDLYDSRSAIVAEEKKKLNEDFSGHICPYCGVDTVGSIDHYLPRSEFPEFSISLQNLVMACSFCNSIYKKTHWGNGAAQRVINPFLNKLPVAKFLVATCVYKHKAITADFSIIPGLPLSDLLERHFVLMNLNHRYKTKAALIELKEIKIKLESKNTPMQKTKALTSFIDDKILVNPENSWRHAYYVSVKPLIPQIVIGGL